MPANLLSWTLVSIPIILLVGNLLHFVFGWSGGSRVLAVVAPVNESVWEHLKMAYWPVLAYTAVAVPVLKLPLTSLWAPAVGFYAMVGLILGLYYLTSAVISGSETKARLVTDGTIFVAAVVVGQLVSYKLSQYAKVDPLIGLLMLLGPAVVLTLTTFAPPRTSLFRDQITGGYGVPPVGRAS